MDDERRYSHESYGMIGVARISGGGGDKLLFGSSLETNNSLLCITIRQAERIHNLGHDRYFGRDEIIRIWMTPAQYAEMISNPNVGYGVPCTIRHINGEEKEFPPKTETEAGLVRERFALDTKDMLKKVEKGADRIDALLDDSKLSNKAKEEIRKTFFEATRFVYDAAPFLVTSFQDAVQKTVIEAKQEVDAFVTHAVLSVGLESLEEKKRATPALPGRT